MATNVGTLVVELTTSIKGLKDGLSQAGSEIQGFSKKAQNWFSENQAVILGATAAIGAAVVKSIQAYGEQEQAVAKLNQALANQGKYSQAASKDLQDFATQMQAVTTFADENIIAVEASLTAFGMEGEQLKKTTKATLDLAAAKGIDLQSAALLLGKAFVGETGTLARYGIVIDQTIPKSKKFEAALGAVNGMFGGQAETMRKTTLGVWAGFQNALSDVQEEIGAFLASDAVGLTKWFTDLFNKAAIGLAQIRVFAGEVGGLGNLIRQNFILAIAAVLQAINELIVKIPGVSQLFKLIGLDVTQMNSYLEDMALNLQESASKSALGASIMGVSEGKKRDEMAKTTQEFVNNENLKTATETEAIVTREQAWINANWERMAGSEELKTKLELDTGHWTDFSFKAINSVTDQMGQGVADMILESRKFSDVIKSIWKDLARMVIAEITRMIAKWLVWKALTSAGGFGGVGFASFAGMAAEGGIINEPSVITGLKSGSQMIAGEAGTEYIVPKKNTFDVGDSGGEPSGGNLSVTVNISGQFLEANENVWQRIVKDKIVPEIRRITMANPTGLFNRRRGATA